MQKQKPSLKQEILVVVWELSMEQKRISCQEIRYAAADTGKVCREG